MVICIRKKKKTNSYNNHLLIVINLIQTDMITIRGLHCNASLHFKSVL